MVWGDRAAGSAAEERGAGTVSPEGRGEAGGSVAAGGRYDEETPGAGARLDRLFTAPLAPWRGTDF